MHAPTYYLNINRKNTCPSITTTLKFENSLMFKTSM